MKHLFILPFLIVGCVQESDYCHTDNGGVSYHCHEYYEEPTTTVVYTHVDSGGGYTNNIIVVEEDHPYCTWEDPYYHDPYDCDYYGCCTWQASVYGVDETYCWNDWCGWELVSVYEYYQEYPYEEEEANPYRIL